MQISRIEKRLKKITGLVEMFKVDGKLSQIEKDLLLDYIRKLYEEILRDDSNADFVLVKKAEKEVKSVVSESVEALRPQDRSEAKTKVIDSDIAFEDNLKDTIKEEPKPILSDQYNELFVFDEVKDVSDRLSLSKISNLNKAIGINEKIFTVKELFGGDNEVYKTTVNALNNMSSMKEAQQYLSENIIPNYGWMDDEKYKKAHNFLKIVRRLYV
jgi:hypothetical protein